MTIAPTPPILDAPVESSASAVNWASIIAGAVAAAAISLVLLLVGAGLGIGLAEQAVGRVVLAEHVVEQPRRSLQLFRALGRARVAGEHQPG